MNVLDIAQKSVTKPWRESATSWKAVVPDSYRNPDGPSAIVEEDSYAAIVARLSRERIYIACTLAGVDLPDLYDVQISDWRAMARRIINDAHTSKVTINGRSEILMLDASERHFDLHVRHQRCN